MEREEVKLGNGLHGQIRTHSLSEVKISWKDLQDCAREVFNYYKPKKYVIYMGGSYYYGRGCKTLAQVRRARISATKQVHFILSVTGVKKRIYFKYRPNDTDYRIRKPRRRRRG